MGTRAARTLHLVLFLTGVVLYVVFVLPRWWVLTGDIPSTLATAGRIAAGIPLAAAALPVMQILQAALKSKPPTPEIALRLRAWSAVLHGVAGVLILLAAIAEIWLSLEAGGPWLFAVYGAAGAIAILAFLALYLSFVAEKPPAEPKPPKPVKAKGKAEKKPRGKKRAEKNTVAKTVSTDETAETAERTAVATETVVVEEAAEPETTSTETVVPETVADETVADETVFTETGPEQPETSGLRNKRPVGKSRLRPGRKA